MPNKSKEEKCGNESLGEGSPTIPSTTLKHRTFVGEPIGQKPVTELAGIGKSLGQKLKSNGFDKASMVLGKFLLLNQDEEEFKKWLQDTCNANKEQSHNCYMCLKEWCSSFLN